MKKSITFASVLAVKAFTAQDGIIKTKEIYSKNKYNLKELEMKNLKVVFAVVAMSLALFSCKKTAQEQTNEADEAVAEAQQNLDEAKQNQQEALTVEALLGTWTATTTNAEGVASNLKITFKENGVYDCTTEVEGAKPEVKTDLAYTVENNIVTLAEDAKLEYANGVLYRLDANGNRLNVEGQTADIFTKVVE